MANENDEDSFKKHVNSSINIFTVIFIIFILIKTVYFYSSNDDNHDSIKKMKFVFTFAFATIFLLFSYFTNVSISENKMICGEKNYKVAFYATIIPFVLIYSIGAALITILDGWIRCFSNTFGVSILNLCGLTEIISKSLNGNAGNSINSKELPYILNEINIGDDGQLTNIDSLTNIDGVDISSIDLQDNIKKYIYCKESIGEGIWHYLLGIITILVSYNTILAENCNAFTVKKDDFKKYLNDKYK